MNLSQNFSLEEMIRSLAHPDIPNVPRATEIANMGLLCSNILEPIRAHFGKPVTIRSGFRSAELNKAVGGVDTSQHLFGQAADLEIYGVPNVDIWNYIFTRGGFDQLIAESLSLDDGSAGWIHVSYKFKNNRKDAISQVKSIYKQGLHFLED